MNNGSKTISLSGILMFILSIILFFISTKERIEITWLGFVFILIAEIILFGGLILIEYLVKKNSQIIIRVGVGFTIVSYAILSIVISIVYMILAKNSIKSLMAIQTTLLVLLFIISAIFITTAKAVKVDSDDILNATGQILDIIGRLNLLKSNNKNKQYEKMLGKVVDDLKYADISTTVYGNDELENQVTKLEIALLKDNEGKEKEVTDLIEEMLMTINKRKQIVKYTKVGGI